MDDSLLQIPVGPHPLSSYTSLSSLPSSLPSSPLFPPSSSPGAPASTRPRSSLVRTCAYGPLPPSRLPSRPPPRSPPHAVTRKGNGSDAYWRRREGCPVRKKGGREGVKESGREGGRKREGEDTDVVDESPSLVREALGQRRRPIPFPPSPAPRIHFHRASPLWDSYPLIRFPLSPFAFLPHHSRPLP